MVVGRVTAITYTGTRRDGTAVTGRLDARAAVTEFVERCFQRRFRGLTVRQGCEIVGAISEVNERGTRAWWAEA